MPQSKAKAKLPLVFPVSNSKGPLFEVTHNLAVPEGRSSTQVSLKARVLMGPDAVVRRKHDIDGVGFKSPSGNDESGLS